jgi:hypothetical protein
MAWENAFGLTSKYWKRRGGADRILVFSEPLHGLWHPRKPRGSFHYIHTQKQLHPPIVISVELSTTFVKMYPRCAAKNILMPYPNTDGRWYNGKHQTQALQILAAWNASVANSSAALPEERALGHDPARVVAQFYSAGNHGTCTQLRQAMEADYTNCATSSIVLRQLSETIHHAVAMNLATFCPCPGGDSPSAKRMFDALLAGCIPIVLSHDFVWPLTNEFDPQLPIDPKQFSLRYAADSYSKILLDNSTCRPLDHSKPGFQIALENVSAEKIHHLRQGVEQMRKAYAWYQPRPDLSDNPLRDNVLPDGGAAHFLVSSLADRAAGVRWPECEHELKRPQTKDPTEFQC